jgi:phage replication initiation protein
VHRKGGWKGFQSSALVTVEDAQVGLMAWGGEAQRGSIFCSLMGTGCQLAGDLRFIVDVAEAREWPLRRVDIAADFVDGSVGFDSMVQAYGRGGFQRSGRPPKMDAIGPIDGSKRGRTCTVGDRTNDQFVRGYEKGLKEYFALVEHIRKEFGDRMAREQTQLEVDGQPVDPDKWFRVEVELKAGKRPIPYEVIGRRDSYFAGSYPYLSEILPDATPEIILTPQRAAQLTLDEALANVRRQFGNTLFTALMVYQGDIGAVWDKIVGSKANEDLLRAGVRLAEAL